MSSIEGLQQQIYQECQEILAELSRLKSSDELVAGQSLIYELSEKTAFLKVMRHYECHAVTSASEGIENQDVKYINNAGEPDTPKNSFFAGRFENTVDSNIGQEFKNSENDYQIDSQVNNENASDEQLKSQQQDLLKDEFLSDADDNLSEELLEEELIAESTLDEDTYERTVEALDHSDAESIASRPAAGTVQQFIDNVDIDAQNSQTLQEKKIKLASIKALKSQTTPLFEEDKTPYQNPEMVDIPKASRPEDHSDNVKSRPDFKLDLNDRIAFTNQLFGGSQSEMDETVRRLNAATTLDEAKEYLSEQYYQRHWKKKDDYAQRLWTLVENRFL